MQVRKVVTGHDAKGRAGVKRTSGRNEFACRNYDYWLNLTSQIAIGRGYLQ
jgi:hypothetical protein